MTNRRLGRTAECAAIILFTFQALRVYLSMLFGCLYDVMFDGEGLPALLVAVVATLGMVAAPLLVPRRGGPQRLLVVVALCAVARVAVSVDHLPVSLVGAAIVIGASAYYVTAILRRGGAIWVSGLAIGVFLDQVLRALGYTYDLGLRTWWLPVQVVVSLGVIWLARRNDSDETLSPAPDEPGFAAGLAYGATLFVLASLLALPNAAARWTHTEYALMVAGQLAVGSLLLWPRTRIWAESSALMQDYWWRRALALLMLVGIMLADRGKGVASALAMLEAGAALWLLLPFSLRAASHDVQADSGRLELGMVVGTIALLLLSVGHAFSFVYAYTVAFFEGAELPVLLLGAAIAVAPALVKDAMPRGENPAPIRWPRWCRVVALFVSLVAVLVSVPWRANDIVASDPVRLGTYNIHYGFDTHWHRSLEEQARTIMQSHVQVVALQEVDAGRLTSFGIDNALWLARRTGMRAVYWPTVEHETGIALLTRLPIVESDGLLLPSEQEPTGLVRATVLAGGEPLHVHGIWLGLSPEERARQLTVALDAIAGRERAVLAGDMNAMPDSPIHEMMVSAGFTDPFETLGRTPAFTDPAISPHKRIDYVWLRGLEATDATVMDSLASDHRMVAVEAR